MATRRHGVAKTIITGLSMILLVLLVLPFLAHHAVPLLKSIGMSLLHRLWVVLQFIVITTAISVGILGTSQKKSHIEDLKADRQHGHIHDTVISKTPHIQHDYYEDRQSYHHTARQPRDSSDLTPRERCVTKLDQQKDIKEIVAHIHPPHSVKHQRMPLVRSSSLDLFQATPVIHHHEEAMTSNKAPTHSTGWQRNAMKPSRTQGSITALAVTTNQCIHDQHVQQSYSSCKVMRSRNASVQKHNTNTKHSCDVADQWQNIVPATLIQNLTTQYEHTSGDMTLQCKSSNKYQYGDYAYNDNATAKYVNNDHLHSDADATKASNVPSDGGLSIFQVDCQHHPHDQPLLNDLKPLQKDAVSDRDGQFSLQAQIISNSKPRKDGPNKNGNSLRHPLARASSDESVLVRASQIYNSKIKSPLMPVIRDKEHDEIAALIKSPVTNTRQSPLLPSSKQSKSDVDLNHLNIDHVYYFRPKRHPHQEKHAFKATRHKASRSCDLKDDYALFNTEPPPPPAGLLAVSSGADVMTEGPLKVPNNAGSHFSKLAHHSTGSSSGLSASQCNNPAKLHDSHANLVQSLVPWRLSNPISISNRGIKRHNQAEGTDDEPLTEGRSSIEVSPSPGELNRKADEFIAKFNKQLVKQKQESLDWTRG